MKGRGRQYWWWSKEKNKQSWMDWKGNFNTNQRNKLRGNGDERRDGREEKIKHTETNEMNNGLQRIQTDNKKKWIRR